MRGSSSSGSHLPVLPAPQGQATDIAIQAEEIMKLKKQLYNIYAKHTKQSLQVIGEHSLIQHTSTSTVPARGSPTPDSQDQTLMCSLLGRGGVDSPTHRCSVLEALWRRQSSCLERSLSQ